MPVLRRLQVVHLVVHGGLCGADLFGIIEKGAFELPLVCEHALRFGFASNCGHMSLVVLYWWTAVSNLRTAPNSALLLFKIQ